MDAKQKYYADNKASFLSCLATSFAVLENGVIGRARSSSALMKLSFGGINPDTIIAWNLPTEGTEAILYNSLAANLPQLILSAIYYLYNSLFTCFLQKHEWDQYAAHRKGLRVSNRPLGEQRSTYFLQIPYRYAVSLMIFSGVLHWCTSQGIFMASFESYTTEGLPGREFITCGYSPTAIASAIVIAIVMALVTVAMSQRRLKGDIPIAATCSASISAMCHVLEREELDNPAFKSLQWGVAKDETGSGAIGQVSHCSFSSREVRLPELGEMCA
jgi:hypothetical protein